MTKKMLPLTEMRLLLGFTLVVSLLLSCWMVVRDNVINPDGICYLLSAQALESASIKTAMHVCPQAKWPLYSMLIFGVVKLTHISYFFAAQLLNTLFSLVSAMTFLFIVRTLGATQRILWLATLVFLFSHELNSLRDNVIRDHGFWAFYLLSFYFLLRYFETPQRRMIFYWSISLLLATLFRIEGAVFLLLMPIVVWCNTAWSWRRRASTFVLMNIPLILLGIILITGFGLYPQYAKHYLTRISELVAQFQDGWYIMLSRYGTTKQALMQHLLPPDSASDAGVVTIFIWLGDYLYNICITLSFGYFLSVLYAWWQNVVIFPKHVKWVAVGYVSLNVLITTVFLAENLFISKRYLVALTLLLMLWVPFALDDLIRKSSSFKHRVGLLVMILFIASSAISGVIEFGPDKSYIKDAGRWMSQQIPQNAKLYTNDYLLMYYSGHFTDDIFKKVDAYIKLDMIADGKWKQYDYLALRLSRNEVASKRTLLAELSEQPIITFKNHRGDQVLIYNHSR